MTTLYTTHIQTVNTILLYGYTGATRTTLYLYIATQATPSIEKYGVARVAIYKYGVAPVLQYISIVLLLCSHGYTGAMRTQPYL